MFNTWKQNNDSYVVLPTEPPFDRPKNGKSRRLACNGCHDRKVRYSANKQFKKLDIKTYSILLHAVTMQ